MEYHRPIHFENTVKEWLHYHGSVPKQGLSCHACFARTSDDGYYCESQKYDHNPFQASGAPRYDMFVGDNGHNHQACYESINRYTRRAKDLSPTVSLTLLRVCRQMYVEGTESLYPSTTFSFRNSRAFVEFCHSLTSCQRKMLREIHVSSAAFGGGEDVDWHFDDEKILPDLPGLMTLHISVNFRFPVLDACDRFKKHSEELTGHDWNQALLRF